MQAQGNPTTVVADPVPPPQPAIPGAATGPGVTTQLPQLPTRPMSRAEIAQIRARGDALSEQLGSVKGRRNEAAEQLRESATGADREGLERLISQLDARILQIEADIAANGQLKAAIAPQTTGTTAPPFSPPVNLNDAIAASIVPIAGIGATILLAPIALAVARNVWRRGNRPIAPPGWTESAARLQRLEQAVDTVAIEVERISEGQRFVTKVLTERDRAGALGAGGAGFEQVDPQARERVAIPRDQSR